VRVHGAMHLPKEIENHVELVEGIANFPLEHLSVRRRQAKKERAAQYAKTHPHNVGASNPGNPATDMIIPQFILGFYGGVPNISVTGLPAPVSQGVIQWEGQYYDELDNQVYTGNLSLPYTPLAANNIIGGNDPTQPGDESQMDIELITGMNPRATNWFWENDGTGWIYSFALSFANTKNVPMLISMSYGLDEQQTCANANCTNVATYFSRTNVEFMKIGLRGISVFAASGDSGANGRSDGGCTEPYLNALYPAASPYITAVGATQPNNPVYNLPATLKPGVCAGSTWTCVSGCTQAAVSYSYSAYASGGGFSNYSAAPSFQTKAVNAYFQSGVTMPPASYYNRKGKAIPDLCAFGIDGFESMSTTLSNTGDGTSMATPTTAGIVSILNSYQIKFTGKPLGFVSPLLYQMWEDMPTAFDDVTIGDNICTEDGCSAGCQGWKATTGWDPVTGLGSIHFQNALAYIKKHAEKRFGVKISL